jgi:phenylacetyl-CoA:acceptor oxidoreductase subunit 1
MVADLQACVGCQTCTAACRHANATPPGVQWRKVLDMEMGEYPDVYRAFVPVGCQHCADPPCLDDGIVTIDYDICIGCGYCAVACPYDARFKVSKAEFAFGDEPTESEAEQFDPRRIDVATKCTFCADKIDFGLENGLTPGVDPDATPACVNSCIGQALHFGDVEDPGSNVSKLLDQNEHFRMHEELETKPGFYYLWDRVAEQDGEDEAAS